MEYRLTKQDLFDILIGWNSFLKKKVHLVACGGTALTLLDIKASTKDVDFIVPELSEYSYLIKTLGDLGYEQITGSGWVRKGEQYIFDLFRGKYIHTTELLESPLEEGKSTVIKEMSYISLAVLNCYDLITSKLFRGASVDYEDCIDLIRAKKEEIDIETLKKHFLETAGYDVSEDSIKKNFEIFLKKIKKEGIYEE
ncbi:MAG: DUF6036 family nucleotidyltransferase [Candidatus Omnitrophota bacterium]|nr:DUF6036 family nucleotidyltransferase [Candidatus Omnitrophota bacterium]